ncbi:MAG: nitrous oxide reductase family maturation protein NosD [Verrucomicrobiaceae bacterium]|nr:nitrous oxide reductase family maturation protein NosD [Verrucomicrobiaceae bacterium]
MTLGATGAEVHVGAGQAHPTITSALAAAAAGDTITVHGGIYAEDTLRITKPLTLAGLEGAVLDGKSRNEIILVSASDVTVRGFTLRDGGRSSTKEFAGIRVESAARVTLADNNLANCDYGIYLAKAARCEVLRNTIEGRPGQELNSGNGIHLWSCEGIHIAGNHIAGHRDGIYLEFASESAVEENLVEGNMRYGLHFMSTHNSRYRKNQFSRNGAGVAVMFSRHVEMTDNVFEFSWGSSAYGLLIKDLTDSSVSGNHFHHNSTAVYCQGATRTVFERNDLRENGWALRILASGEDNTFSGNNFSGNSFDVGTNGQLVNHVFKGNYWDRYEGYDLKRDGGGDVPFRPVSLYSMVTERVPASLFLLHSFMVQLLDRAEKAFPSITPESVLDSSPAMKPHQL